MKPASPVGFNLTFVCPQGQVFKSDWLAIPFVMMTCQVGYQFLQMHGKSFLMIKKYVGQRRRAATECSKASIILSTRIHKPPRREIHDDAYENFVLGKKAL